MPTQRCVATALCDRLKMYAYQLRIHPLTGPWVESACMSSCLHHLPPCSFVIFLCACHLYKRASGRRLVLYCPSSP